MVGHPALTLDALVYIADEAAALRDADRAVEAAGGRKTGCASHDRAVDAAEAARAVSRKRIDRALVAWRTSLAGS